MRDAELPSQRGETWNDTESIARPRAMTPFHRRSRLRDSSRPATPPLNAVLVDLGQDDPAPVCSLADLRAMKLASGRPRDLVDVTELDELHGLGRG